MNFLSHIRYNNLIFLILVSIISFYILRLSECVVDTFYPLIEKNKIIQKLKEKNKKINIEDFLKLLIKIILTSLLLIIFINFL